MKIINLINLLDLNKIKGMINTMNASIYETISSCRICGSEDLNEFLNLGSQPPANSLTKKDDPEIQRVPLRLLFCNNCKVVQIGESVDPKFLFSKYVWVTGTSKGAHKHSKFFFESINKRNRGFKSTVLEIASNDGTFLKEFQNQGYEVIGVDPAINIAEIATSNGIPTIAQFFDEKFALGLKNKNKFFNIIYARNVIPHVKNIHSVISGINILLATDGLGAIEFHDASLILNELHYDSIYHEHIFYFSIKTLSYILSRYGLEVFDLAKSPISGGSWIIYFAKEKRNKSKFLIKAISEENQLRVNTIQKWNKFALKTISHAEDLKFKIKNFKGKIIGYGASARSSTLLNYCNINNSQISYIVDNNKLKHNLLTPGTNIKIVSKDLLIEDKDNINLIILLAWNFKEEILEDIRKIGYTGKIIVPLPDKVQIL